MPTKVEISYKTIVFTITTIIGLWFLWQLRQVIFLLFISLILVSGLHSPVDWLNSKKIPRVLSIILIYIILLILLVVASIIIVPAINEQYKILVERLPFLIDQINKSILFLQIPADEVIANPSQQFVAIGRNLFKITTGAFGTLLGFLTLLVLTFYLLLEWQKVVKFIASPFSGLQEKKVINLINDIENSLGRWVRGQITLSVIVGILVYIGLTALGVPSALPLALLAGILEIVPIIGPIISAIPSILIALTFSPILAVATGALYFIIQQLENNLIVPAVMSRAVGINPLVTIIALMIGAKLAGVLGVILSVPVVVIVKILIKDLLLAKTPTIEEIEKDFI